MTSPTSAAGAAAQDALLSVFARILSDLRAIGDHADRVAAVAAVQDEPARLAERLAAVTRDTVIHLRDVDALTFAAIGQRLGFSQQRASQIYSAKRPIPPEPVGRAQ